MSKDFTDVIADLDFIRRAKEQLSESEQKVIVKYLEGLEIKEIADSLNAPIKTIYSRMRSARDKMRYFAKKQGMM
jgi:DNA-directed RNA polymerase specialized sigma24 family protein